MASPTASPRNSYPRTPSLTSASAIPALIWSAGLLIAFFPIGLWLYQRRTSQ